MNRANQLLHSSLAMQKSIRYYIRKTAQKNGLTNPQYSILMMMNRYEHITQKKIREKTFLPKSTLSNAIDGLVKRELLVRKLVTGNRREVELVISDKGRKFISMIFSQKDSIHYLFQQAIESLSEEQFTQLLQTHKQITTYLQQQGNDNL